MQSVNKHIQWDDIIGHVRPKELLKEAIVYPIKVSICMNFFYYLKLFFFRIAEKILNYFSLL